MHSTRIISSILLTSLLVLLFFSGTVLADSQSLADQEIVLEIPSGGDQSDLSLSGERLTAWTQADGIRVMLYEGDFSARCSAATLTSSNAVIWLTRVSENDKAFYNLRIYLQGQAKVVRSTGTTVQDSALLLRLQVFRRIIIEAIERTNSPHTQHPIYLRAIDATRDPDPVDPPPVEPSPKEPIVIESGTDEISGQPDTTAETKPTERTTPEGTQPPVREPPRVVRAGPVKLSPGPVFWQGTLATVRRGNELIHVLQADDRGPVYVSQGATKGKLLLEMMADAAVVFQDAGILEQNQSQGQADYADKVAASFTGVYLKGNVVLLQGDRTIRAKEVYYDLHNQRALINEALVRSIMRQRNVPTYIHAQQLRQISEREFVARNAKMTSSDFASPDFFVGAGKLLFRDVTPRDDQGNRTGPQKLRVNAENITLNIGGFPFLWWPGMTADLERGESPLHKLVLGHSNKNGFTVKSEWWLFRLLGLEEPEDVNLILGVDYMSQRGPALRLELDYLRDNYEGYAEGIIMQDHGQDRLSRTREDLEPPRDLRGRFLLRHRHYLPRDWEMQLEASYISDANFLEEFMEKEFDTGKDQEAAIYFKKQRENWAFSILANTRLMDFVTVTSHYPEARFVLIGEPIASVATGFLDARAGFLQLENNNTFPAPSPMDSSDLVRGDIRGELDLPLQIGPLKLVPYASGRATAWDDSPTDGGQQRYFFTAGMRAGTQFWRVYDKVQSRMLDLNRLRHIIEPQVHLFWAGSNSDHGELGTHIWPLDQEVEGLRDFAAVSVALLQTFQTKRGPADRQRDVDWFEADIRATFFNQNSALFGTQDFSDPAFPTNMTRMTPRGRWFDYRPENSFPRDNIQADFSLRVSDTTLLFSDLTYALAGGSLDRFNVGLAVTRSPRLSYFIADRYNRPTDMHVLTGGATYKLNEKYTISASQQMDIEQGRSLATNLMLVRKFPRWYMSISANIDRSRDEAVIMLNIWPEGLPAIRLGTGVGGSMPLQ